MNKSRQSREYLVEQSVNSTLSLVVGNWKYIEPSKGPAISKDTNIELGNLPQPQLYNLGNDPAETTNVADVHPAKVNEMKQLLDKIKQQ